MSGAGSFFLGLFGLGASAGISAGQSISQKKAVHEAVEKMGYVGPLVSTRFFWYSRY